MADVPQKPDRGVTAGRELARLRRLPSRREVSTDTATDRGRAMHASRRGDRAATDALAGWQPEDSDDAA